MPTILSCLAHRDADLTALAFHCLRNLHGTRLHCRTFYGRRSPLILVAFTGAEWASNKHTRKSVSGNPVFLGTTIISTASRKQLAVSTVPAASNLNEIFNIASQVYAILNKIQQRTFASCDLFGNPY